MTYPNGTPGWFTRDDERGRCFGWLWMRLQGGMYWRYSDPELTHYSGKFTNFEPLTEAIEPYEERK